MKGLLAPMGSHFDDARIEQEDEAIRLARAEHEIAWVPQVDEKNGVVLWDAPCRCHGLAL